MKRVLASSAGSDVRGHFYGQSPAQISAGNSEISPPSFGMKPKAALFQSLRGQCLGKNMAFKPCYAPASQVPMGGGGGRQRYK